MMSFSGRVDKQSHNGGLLVSFEGRPPRLGANIRITGGKILGKVETVIGPVDDGLIHLYPISEEINLQSAVGSPVEIAPRVNSNRKNRKKFNNRRDINRRDSSDRRGNSKYRSRGKAQVSHKKRRSTNFRRSDSKRRNGRNFKSGRSYKGKRRK